MIQTEKACLYMYIYLYKVLGKLLSNIISSAESKDFGCLVYYNWISNAFGLITEKIKEMKKL